MTDTLESITYPLRVLTGTIGITYDTWLPYASACLISYAKQNLSKDEFLFEEPLYKPLDESLITPRLHNVDVLALTAYSWNEATNSSYTRIFKQINPSGIVIWGGPNIPKNTEKFSSYAATHNQVDLFVIGPGEEAFVEILKKIKYKEPLPRRWDSKQKHFPDKLLHSPYADGTLDSIINYEPKIKASFETNRGCPYSCSFCDWGGLANSKIEKLPKELVYETIDSLFSKKNIAEIEILDANFGLFEQDLFYLQKMVDAQKKYNTSVHVSYSGLAKNGSPYLEPILLALTDHFQLSKRHLKISFQTHTQEVLETAQRKNIRKEKLVEILNIKKKRNIPITSEMILGLPGENATSWVETLQEDIRLGIDFTRTYILSISENTLLTEKNYAEKHQILIKKVFFPNSFKKMDRRRIHLPKSPSSTYRSLDYEQHQLIYSCASYDLDELKRIYGYWWFHHNFYNSKALKNTLYQLTKKGVSYKVLIDSFFSSIRNVYFLNKILKKMNDVIELYYKPERETYIYDEDVYYFTTGPLRLDDIYVFWQNQVELKSILNIVLQPFLNDVDVKQAFFEDISLWQPQKQGNIKSLLGLEASLRGSNVV